MNEHGGLYVCLSVCLSVYRVISLSLSLSLCLSLSIYLSVYLSMEREGSNHSRSECMAGFARFITRWRDSEQHTTT